MGIMWSLRCIIKDNFQIQAPRGLYSEGLIIGDIFAFQIRRASIQRGLYMEGLIFGILWYVIFIKSFLFCSLRLHLAWICIAWMITTAKSIEILVSVWKVIQRAITSLYCPCHFTNNRTRRPFPHQYLFCVNAQRNV